MRMFIKFFIKEASLCLGGSGRARSLSVHHGDLSKLAGGGVRAPEWGGYWQLIGWSLQM